MTIHMHDFIAKKLLSRYQGVTLAQIFLGTLCKSLITRKISVKVKIINHDFSLNYVS